jgi:hypothetical protein
VIHFRCDGADEADARKMKRQSGYQLLASVTVDERAVKGTETRATVTTVLTPHVDLVDDAT